MLHSIAVLLLAAAVGPAGASWRGTVIVEGMIHEPGGYHPYTAMIRLHLRETRPQPVPGGFRVGLVSDGSIQEVRTSVHQTDGPMLCSGTGTESLPQGRIGYLEAKAGRATYHLAIPRAFGAFACGQNKAIKRNRVVVIGHGDPEPAEIETADSALRVLEEADSAMKGSFQATRKQGAVRYEYDVRWSLTRASPRP